MNDAERTNQMFVELAEKYNYEGELFKAETGTIVQFNELLKNMINIFEHRFEGIA